MDARYLFARSYVEAAVFADWPEDATPGASWGGDTLAELTNHGEAFYDLHQVEIADYSEGVTQAGHDLWYTRNGHGVGYWENEGEHAADVLDAAAKALGEVSLYVGDNGMVYAA